MTDETEFSPGDVVLDRDDETPNPAVVINCVPGATADEWTVPGGKTVAEANPDYPEDAAVVVVVFETDLAAAALEWNREDPIALAEVSESSLKYYSFPVPRLVHDPDRIPSLTDIQHVGESRAKDLRTAGYESVAEIAAADTNALAEMDGIGETRAAHLVTSATDLLGNLDDVPGEIETDPGESRKTTDDRDLSAATVALSRYLDSDGMDAAITDDGQSVRVSTADESYRISLDGGVEGDGPHRSQLEKAVEKVRTATQAPTE